MKCGNFFLRQTVRSRANCDTDEFRNDSFAKDKENAYQQIVLLAF